MAGQFKQLVDAEWHELLAREGLAPPPVSAPGESSAPVCPACGTAAPLVDGACSECGLQLA